MYDGLQQAAGLIFKFDISAIGCLAVGALFYGLVGCADDYIKVVKKRNLGLTSAQKFLGQLIVAVIVTVFAVNSGVIDTQIIIPFIKSPFFFFFLSIWTE